MKRIFALILVALFMVTSLTACGKTAVTEKKKPLRIVTTIFPEYDWVKEILGSHAKDAELTLLLDNGVDLHSFQPTVDDMVKISSCDMFIYVGGESDKWVEGALKEAKNKNMVVINLLKVLGDKVKEEEVKEGMQAEAEDHAEHEHGKDEHAKHDHEKEEHAKHDHAKDEHAKAEHAKHEHAEEGPEYDEHVWLSLKNAATLTQYISDKLCQLDKAHAEDYKKNTAAYIAKLQSLDKAYEETVTKAPVKTVLFGDRFPFRYLVDDYGLDYYAAFVGCSAETEASFETIVFLAKKVDQLMLPAVMTIEGAEHKIAKTIIQNTQGKKEKILTLDSMQSTTSKDVKAGTTYLSVMTKNLETLKEALSK